MVDEIGASNAMDARRAPALDLSVSVVVPTRGRPGFLRLALESLSKQTRRPDEVVVSEDGADAGTAEVIARFQPLLPLKHVTHDPPVGQLLNRMGAFSRSSGDLVGMLDDDDEWEPTFLERTAKAMEGQPECGFCSTDHWLISGTGSVLEAETDAYSALHGRKAFVTGVQDDVLSRELRFECYSLQSSLFRREALEHVGFFPSYADLTPDLALFLELGALGYSCFFIDERLVRYRVHAGQTTSTGGRVARSASRERTFRFLAQKFALTGADFARLAHLYRKAVVEHAVAHAHQRQRVDALRVLSRYSELGWGLPPARRLVVFAALMAGIHTRIRAKGAVATERH
jgi:glycosyltransferase involved in cell wall biosynthesis